MPKIVFESYDPQENTQESQRSNVAFMMLAGALNKTEIRPDQPKLLGEWRAMARLLEEFEKIGTQVEATIPTEQGPQKALVTVLKPEGGEVDLTDDSLELLKKVWDTHVERHLNLAHARQVVLVKEFLRKAEAEE